MKKLLLLSTILLLSVSPLLWAQSSNLRFGPTVALNFSTFNGKDANQFGNISSKTAFSIGGFMNYRFAEMFALQPELSFTMKGASSTSNNVNYTFTANYFEVPVLVKAYIPLAIQAPVKLTLYGGPAIALNLASSVEAQSGSQTANQDLKDQTKSVDLGLVIGGGVSFGAGSGILDLSLRYTLGLTTTDNSGSNLTITNGVFAIVGAYAF